MFAIERLGAREILDSRGRPTVLAECILRGGALGSASVPSGASTGTAEAVELRDGDPRRYRGLGCRKAVAKIQGELNAALKGNAFETQEDLDARLVSLDGTPAKSRLGANAILAVSLAFARAAAAARGEELWHYFSDLVGIKPRSLPRLTINLFSGGKHAGQQVAIQDVLIVPVSTRTVDDSLAMSWEVYQIAAEISLRRFGMRLLRADEGGMAPPFRTPEEMIETAIEAIEGAGLQSGKDVALAIDVAGSHFHSAEGYHIGDELLSSEEMIGRLRRWTDTYPVVSVEDGLAEDDWQNWPGLLSEIGDRALVLGDDLLCTNTVRIQRAIESSACNALLLKVNQVGTLSEACQALQLARKAGWQVTVSVRSGETEDTWAADLAVGWSADQFKNGSLTQSERLAKYNRLLAIESGTSLPTNSWPSGCIDDSFSPVSEL
jgi:enolase